MTPRLLERTAVGLAVIGLFVSVLATVALPAGAAGQTTVRPVPDTDQLSVHETTTVRVVATNVDSGVGAYNATVSLDTPHATITNASVNAQLERVQITDDGSSAHMAVALMDTADKREVTIATLTVEGVTTGTSTLSVRVNTLADKEGRIYQVTSTPETTMTITEQSTPDVSRATEGGTSADGTGADEATPSSESTGNESPIFDAEEQVTTGADGSDGLKLETIQVGSSPVTIISLAILACAVVAGLLVRRLR